MRSPEEDEERLFISQKQMKAGCARFSLTRKAVSWEEMV